MQNHSPMELDVNFMKRCLQLASLGKGKVSPNPMVGAVLVHEGRIIGEGYHKEFGQAHAEVNCFRSVKQQDLSLIEKSDLYVSLEPCAHFGKTPPCADLIIEKKVPRVFVGCRDPFAEVDGKGIEKLVAAGVQVESGVLQQECQELNKRFFTFHNRKRPYIILKWAETSNGKIAGDQGRLMISNAQSNRLVHKWRSREMSIMVGTNTALFDDPELNTRLWPGASPIRLVVDPDLRLPAGLKLFSATHPTIVFNLRQHTLPEKSQIEKLRSPGVYYYQVSTDANFIHQSLNALYQLNIQSVLVEGGAKLLQSFIDEGAWDEARIIRNTRLTVSSGLSAPILKKDILSLTESFGNDTIRTFKNTSTY